MYVLLRGMGWQSAGGGGGGGVVVVGGGGGGGGWVLFSAYKTYCQMLPKLCSSEPNKNC